jgi:hypothetical protein
VTLILSSDRLIARKLKCLAPNRKILSPSWLCRWRRQTQLGSNTPQQYRASVGS